MGVDKEKVKKTVKNNFKVSVEKYFSFEKKYNFFYNLTVALARFAGVEPSYKILDVGCGYGVSCKALKDKFQCDVIGVDLSEEMVNFGKKIYEEIEISVCDGENLSSFSENYFDTVLYNASIFIFPDTLQAFKSAKTVLKERGSLGFSHYPAIVGERGENLLELAYERARFNMPRRNVISPLEICVENLEKSCFKNITLTDYTLPLDIEFLENFFLIPAQSASLFPKLTYAERAEKIKILFKQIANEKGDMIWKLVKAEKK